MTLGEQNQYDNRRVHLHEFDRRWMVLKAHRRALLARGMNVFELPEIGVIHAPDLTCDESPRGVPRITTL